MLLLGAIGWLLSRENGRAATVEVSPHRIAVFPLEVQAGAGREYLGHGTMTMLSNAIDGAGELRRVDPQALTSVMRLEGQSSLGPEQAQAIAARFGAGRYVLGTVVAVGPSIGISVSLYDPIQSSEPIANLSVDGREEDFPLLVTRLARDLLDRLGAGSGDRWAELSEVRTASFPALKAYLVGEDLLRRGRADSAVAALQESVALDSTFALAWYRLGWAHEWASPGHPGGYTSLQHAVSYRQHLSERDRLLLDGWYSVWYGQGAEAASLGLQAVTRYPDNLEAWHLLAGARHLYGWQHPTPLSEAITAYERAFTLDPNHPLVLWNYTWALRQARQLPLVDSLYRAARQKGIELFAAEPQSALMAVLTGGAAQRDSALAELQHWNPFDVSWVIEWLHTATDSLTRIAAARPSGEPASTSHLPDWRSRQDVGRQPGRSSQRRQNSVGRPALLTHIVGNRYPR
jgi:tetratricopeptide (TPR) repeat protein